MYFTIKRHDYFNDYPININGIMRVQEYSYVDFENNNFKPYVYFCEIIYLDGRVLRTRYTENAILRRINKLIKSK